MLKPYLCCAKLKREKLILDWRLKESAEADVRQTIREEYDRFPIFTTPLNTAIGLQLTLIDDADIRAKWCHRVKHEAHRSRAEWALREPD
jgi:hypothetical protein